MSTVLNIHLFILFALEAAIKSYISRELFDGAANRHIVWSFVSPYTTLSDITLKQSCFSY